MARAQAPCIENLNPRGLLFNFQLTNNFEVINILQELKRNKAVGYDDIPASLMIHGAKEIAGLLNTLIIAFWMTLLFPLQKKLQKLNQNKLN